MRDDTKVIWTDGHLAELDAALALVMGQTMAPALAARVVDHLVTRQAALEQPTCDTCHGPATCVYIRVENTPARSGCDNCCRHTLALTGHFAHSSLRRWQPVDVSIRGEVADDGTLHESLALIPCLQPGTPHDDELEPLFDVTQNTVRLFLWEEPSYAPQFKAWAVGTYGEGIREYDSFAWQS